MGELSADWQRGWDACLAGRTLYLGLGSKCARPDFADGYIACMSAFMKGTVSTDTPVPQGEGK